MDWAERLGRICFALGRVEPALNRQGNPLSQSAIDQGRNFDGDSADLPVSPPITAVLALRRIFRHLQCEKRRQDLPRRIKFFARRGCLENFPRRLLNGEWLGQLLRKARGAPANFEDESSEGHGLSPAELFSLIRPFLIDLRAYRAKKNPAEA
jgi:hypothetical protein